MPGLPIGSHSSPPAAHRCIGGKAYRQPTVKKGFACGGKPPERRKVSPSAEEKDGAAVLDLTVHAVEQIGSPAEGDASEGSVP